MFKRGFRIANDSIGFVFSNLDVLKHHLLVLFPIFLVVALGNHMAVMYEYYEASLVAKIFMGYVLSCFTLTWHRVALRGIDETPHSPLDFAGKALAFHAVFFAIFIAMTGIDYGIRVLEANPQFIDNNLALSFAILISALVCFYFLMRFMFALPAQSVGVTLSFKDVWTSSRGQAGALIVNSLYVGFLMVMAITIYIVVMTAINMFVIGDSDISKNMAAGISFFISIPVYVAMFIYAAIEVVALSKLYQDGMRNNA